MGSRFSKMMFSGLFEDYIVDGALSFADEPFGGLVGGDWGDWIGSVWIFIKEKKVSGTLVALFCAWEATNFLPFSLIPGVGTGIEIITNLFPAVTTTRTLFNKYGPAEKQQQKLEKAVVAAEQAGISVSKAREAMEKAREMIGKANPVGALKKMKTPLKELSSKLNDYANDLISETQGIIQNIASQKIQAPDELTNILRVAISGPDGKSGSWGLLQEAQNALENEKDADFATAINLANNAKMVIISAAQEFDSAFQQYQIRMQQEQSQQPSHEYVGPLPEETQERLEKWKEMQRLEQEKMQRLGEWKRMQQFKKEGQFAGRR